MKTEWGLLERLVDYYKTGYVMYVMTIHSFFGGEMAAKVARPAAAARDAAERAL